MTLRLKLCLLLTLMVVLCGCGNSGPELGYVEGVVTLDGTPVPGAVVKFLPKDRTGSTSFGETDESGRFTARFSHRKEGVLLGEHDITILVPPRSDEDGNSLPPIVKIPRKYANRGELAATVEPGHQEINFSLSASGS